MEWIETRVKTSYIAMDAVTDFLYTLGANGVEILEQKDAKQLKCDADGINLLDTPIDIDSGVVLRAYFPFNCDIESIKMELASKIKNAQIYMNCGNIDITTSVVDDEDWANAWKKYYKPFNITENIMIKPSWEEIENDGEKDDQIIIEMDPGMAFGTGTHETTIMCACLIEQYVKQGYNVIDVGCGSGILSIIAAKLGVSFVHAIDIDEVAIRATKENAYRNDVETQIHYTVGTIDNLSYIKADVIFANIVASIIIDLCEKLKYYLKPNGIFIASGIIKERAEDVLNIFRNNGFIDIEQRVMGEWVAIVFKWQGSL